MDAVSLAYGYGWRNSGDLAINQGSIDYLNRLFPDVRPQVVSMFPASSGEFRETERRLAGGSRRYELIGGPIHYDPKTQSTLENAFSLAGDGIRYVFDRANTQRLNQRLGSQMATTVRNSDFCFYNGGNLLHNNRSLPYLLGVLYPLQVAQQHDVPYGVLPHTMFDLEGRYRDTILSLLEGSEFVWTRDSRSYEYLTTELSLSCPVRNGLDTAFFSADVSPADLEQPTGEADPTSVSVVPRFSTLGDTGTLENDEFESQFERFLVALRERGYEVDVTVQTKVEEEWVDRNRAMLRDHDISVFESYDPDTLRAHYRETDLLVTMRLHAGIFALSVGTPSIGLYRDEWGPKTPGTWETLGIERYALSGQALTVDRLLGLCEDALNERLELGKQILERVAEKRAHMLTETAALLGHDIEQQDVAGLEAEPT